jgi:hypothetical protein
MDSTHVIAVLATLLTMSEIFFPFLTPYQGFIDGFINLLNGLGKEIKDSKPEVIQLPPSILKKEVHFEPSIEPGLTQTGEHTF